MNNTALIRGLTDTHAHLSYLQERGIDISQIDALVDDGFGFILDIGTAAGDFSPRWAQLSRYANVRFSCGIWPHAEDLAHRFAVVARLEQDLDHAPAGAVVAIGECGFDRRENPAAPPEECELLELQLDLATRRNLPVIIHSREAPRETIETLARYPAVRGVIHCFSYTLDEARCFLDLGYMISFAG
ncbi:MAG: TatD family hydrolase, partial [Spirochaetaceae bacterium]|nr:TatD family hydrolase [Spirochaetaceae bacterium]